MQCKRRCQRAEELSATHEDVRYLRCRVNMLVRNDAAQDAAINPLTARMQRLEKNLGMTH
jgi:predicted nucleic acid-binding Zn ribbon protein